MNCFLCLFLLVAVTQEAVLPFRPNCANVMCTMDLKICPDGTRAPVPVGGCCPSLSACRPLNPVVNNCWAVFCTMDLKICPNGSPAPIPAGGCCPSLEACDGVGKRNINLGSLLSGSNVLQTLSGAAHGTNIGTVLSLLNLLNNVHQLSNDIHSIPAIINETLTNILNGTGQASEMILQQLLHAGAAKPSSRNLLGSLGQNANLLGSIGHLLPQGTSLSTIFSILNLLNNVHQLSNDVHSIPLVINQTLSSILNVTGAAGQNMVQQLLNLLHPAPTGRINILGALGQNANILSSITHLLPQGTSISTILSLLSLLNNVHQLSNDVHSIPLVINQTLSSILNVTGAAGQNIVQQLLDLVKPHSTGRSGILETLGHNANLISSITHLLPTGTSIQTILSLVSLLSNVNALSTDLHQIPVVLQETINNILNGVQQLIPPTLQPVSGSS